MFRRPRNGTGMLARARGRGHVEDKAKLWVEEVNRGGGAARRSLKKRSEEPKKVVVYLGWRHTGQLVGIWEWNCK